MKEFIKKIIPSSLLLQYHKFLAKTAAAFYKNPSDDMVIIGVTGTDGKTSTTIIISQLLDSLGISNAYATTAEFKLGQKKWTNKTKQTMQGRFALQKFLHEAKKEKITCAVIETSSQGIQQFRHIGINYDVAVFTNLSEDHIEAHGSFENYKNEKIKLFKKVAKDKKKNIQNIGSIKKTIAVNADDTHMKDFLIEGAENYTLYTTKQIEQKEEYNYIQAENIIQSGGRQEFALTIDQKTLKTSTKLQGLFNIQNILAATAAVKAFNVDAEKILDAVQKLQPLPGRLETIDEGQNFTVIVDYAHAENALENVLNVAKKTTKGKIISVMGSCGGGRDVEKRPRMGQIAAKYADYVILTNEDPYDEDPQKIIADIEKGLTSLERKEGVDYKKIIDRKEAIAHAFKKAQHGDTVLITGKGSEQSMIVKGGKIPWDDRKVARELIHEIVANKRNGNSEQ